MTESISPEPEIDTTLIEAAMSRAREARDRRVDIHLESLGIWLTCRIPADGREVERLQRAAERVEKGAVQNTEFQRALVATFTEVIHFDGRPVVDANGDPLTFNNPVLWKLCDPPVQDSKSCVIAWLATDGAIANVATQLIDYGGWRNANDADPI